MPKQKLIRNGKKILSAAHTILAVLWQAGEGSVKVFFPPRYAKKYGYPAPVTYYSAVSRLRKNGLIKQKSKMIFTLTPKGEKEALFAYLNGEVNDYKPSAPKKWDGGWRIVFFDVPERKRRYRDFLRVVLKAIGFKEFQQSVWIYPHPVPSFLRDLLFDENIKQYTRFVTTESVEYEGDLRKMFPETFFRAS